MQEDSFLFWLIIQVSNLQIPERAILLLPLVIFLPRVVEWLRRKRFQPDWARSPLMEADKTLRNVDRRVLKEANRVLREK